MVCSPLLYLHVAFYGPVIANHLVIPPFAIYSSEQEQEYSHLGKKRNEKQTVITSPQQLPRSCR